MDELLIDPAAEPSPANFSALLRANKGFDRLWRKTADAVSIRDHCIGLAKYAIQASWSDQETVNLIIYWCRKANVKLHFTVLYYTLVLAEAHRRISMDQAQHQLGERLPHPAEDQMEELKIHLSTLLEIGIIRFVKYLGDPPIYHMHTTEGEITLGEVSAITSQPKFRDAVAAATGKLIPAVSKRVWDTRAQAILLLCEDVDLGEVSRPTEETRSWVQEYLLTKGIREEHEWQKGAEAKSPFIWRGKTHIFLENLRIWLAMTMSEQPTTPVLARRLRQCGALPHVVGLKIGGQQTTRSCWQLPPDLLEQGGQESMGEEGH